MPTNILEIEKQLKEEIGKLETKQCENSLATFTKAAWHIIEPGTPLIWNWHLDTLCAYLEATVDPNIPQEDRITRLIINIPPGSLKSVLVSVMYPAWLWIRNPDKRILGVSNSQDLAIRDSRRTKQIITDDWFTQRWSLVLMKDQSAKTNYENEKGGFRVSLGITANITGKRGDIVIIDDPHDASTAQSDLIRQSVLDIYDTKLSTRVNSQEESIFILVMQRLHAQDLTGHLLNKKKTKWVHVVMPMHYDKAFTFDPFKDIKKPQFRDPRKNDELLFPKLFSEKVVTRLEEDLGEYACTPAETPILMADLTEKPISEIKIGDRIIGFNDTFDKTKSVTGVPGHKDIRIATVTKLFKYEDRTVVEHEMSNGTFIRCTPDHKWLMESTTFNRARTFKSATPEAIKAKKKNQWGFKKPSKAEYLKKQITVEGDPSKFRSYYAAIGTKGDNGAKSEKTSKLVAAEEQSASRLSYITIDDKIKDRIDKFTYKLDKFTYRLAKDIRLEKKSEVDEYTEAELQQMLMRYRYNRKIKNNWRGKDGKIADRTTVVSKVYNVQYKIIVDGKTYKIPAVAKGQLNASLMKRHRGKQTVYAMETTTGNYVAWRHISKNSAGQLEQRPSPKGGGILRQSWFRILDDTSDTAIELPECTHIFISCDTAYSEKDMKTNSYSAFTTWGVFWNQAQQRDCILLLDVWFDQVNYPDLRRKAHTMDKRIKPDVWLIEKKSSGQALVADLRRSGLMVRTYIPTTDKISRAYAIQPMLESGQVWIPNRKWAHAFAYAMGTFPTGSSSSADLADTCTQALLYIRNGLYVSHPDDTEFERPEIKYRSAYGGHVSEDNNDVLDVPPKQLSWYD